MAHLLRSAQRLCCAALLASLLVVVFDRPVPAHTHHSFCAVLYRLTVLQARDEHGSVAAVSTAPDAGRV